MSDRLIYTPLEQDVLIACVSMFPEVAAIMGAQLAMTIPRERTIHDKGFYIAFETHNVPVFDEDFEMGLSAEIEGLVSGAGFILLIREGKIAFLEGFTYGEDWPETIGAYRIYRPQPTSLEVH